MEFRNLIKKRASIKHYLTKKPDWRKIVQAIDAARYVPLAGNINALKFILVRDKKKIEAIKQATQQKFVGDAHYIVVAVSNTGKLVQSYNKRGEIYARQQAGAAIQNFLLAITDLGLATCWVGYFDDNAVKRELKIPDNHVVEAIFPVGKAAAGARKKSRKKVDLENVIYFDKWKNTKMDPIVGVKHEHA